MWIQVSGMKKLEQSVQPGTYKTLWCAGQSVELINDISSCEDIIKRLKKETGEAFEKISTLMQPN